ncbi:MAG: hypothetical protein ACD_70C00221G0002 [uncultured bacterium]|nr:MAG: hypothetical protein ACD_70C00221G0002 [uncultured bacterium]
MFHIQLQTVPMNVIEISDPLLLRDFEIYCRDLQAVTHGVTIPNFSVARGYSFSFLVDYFFKMHPEYIDFLKNTEHCALIHYTDEFSPQHTHVGAYLSDHYAMSTRFLDISEQGVLSVISAMQILYRLLSRSTIQSAAIVAFEQTALGLSADDLSLKPETSGVGILFFDASFQLKRAQIFSSRLHDPAQYCQSFIQDLQMPVISHVLIQRGGNFAGNCSTLQTISPGIFPIFAFLKTLISKPGCHFVLIEDVLRVDWGCLVFESIDPAKS